MPRVGIGMLDFAFGIWRPNFARYKDNAISVMPEKCWPELYINNFANNLNLLCDDFWNIAPEEDRNFDQWLK